MLLNSNRARNHLEKFCLLFPQVHQPRSYELHCRLCAIDRIVGDARSIDYSQHMDTTIAVAHSCISQVPDPDPQSSLLIRNALIRLKADLPVS